jgi:hypothetical protein
VAWVKANLFGDWKTTLATIVIGGLLLWYVPQILNWALFNAPSGCPTLTPAGSTAWAPAGAWSPKSTADHPLAAIPLKSNGAHCRHRLLLGCWWPAACGLLEAWLPLLWVGGAGGISLR